MNTTNASPAAPAKADFSSDQEVRWCPGCGDYSILKQVQTLLEQSGRRKEEVVFISGIGCSSRFPYYLDTFGLHGIHGRAPAIVGGLRSVRPDLSVWMITGDGDALSIGGNHIIHLLRRNVDVNVLLFNNEIYGLTKGQYSPTSPEGAVTRSTPLGSTDHPFNPLALVKGADGTFIARCMDRDPKHMREVLARADAHRGTSLVEVYQNCNVFNDGAFEAFTEKGSKADNTLFVEHGKPLLFANGTKGISLQDMRPTVIDIGAERSVNDCWVHDERDSFKASLLVRLFDDPRTQGGFPRPFGVLFVKDRPTHEAKLQAQVQAARERKGQGDLDALLRGDHTWEIV
ncbi:MAG: 2-oxoacid:ferredoxin oxidoreductase subunit beta [Flavobacteriales bacterium]|nr:2-oxoglutarate oxidoreductase subunit KorB [Flavobacteriales bacterium]MCC6577959.1 2-oxoacid:ferredoxin oxidoreductase subunit beta [Flavobacteriales bacterium]NUQ14405.1 2-oxoacid:ferredoxin oxidoreductase subunit beta [Flavobacteriales bacterium]